VGKKISIELNDQTYKELLEIAGLCKEAPEELLMRAFMEWVRLREDLDDAEFAREALAEYEREGGISHEEVGAELAKPPSSS